VNAGTEWIHEDNVAIDTTSEATDVCRVEHITRPGTRSRSQREIAVLCALRIQCVVNLGGVKET